MDILRRSRLLDETADCQGLAGLYSVLYEREPSNNTINWLLLTGALHEWINSPDTENNPICARFAVDTKVSTLLVHISISVPTFINPCGDLSSDPKHFVFSRIQRQSCAE